MKTGIPDSAATALSFDDIQVGAVLGRSTIVLDAESRHAWEAIYGPCEQGEVVPGGVLIAVMMRALMAATQPRPVGNIHASQKVVFGVLPRWGDTLSGEVRCLSKELRRGRRWISFGVRLNGLQSEAIFGEVQTVWAI